MREGERGRLTKKKEREGEKRGRDNGEIHRNQWNGRDPRACVLGGTRESRGRIDGAVGH